MDGIYLSPSEEHIKVAESAQPNWTPEIEMSRDTTNLVSGRGYGFFTWGDLFTQRQLTTLTTFSDLVSRAGKKINADAIKAGYEEAGAYADAVVTYLAFAIDKTAEGSTQFCTWSPLPSKLHVVSTFGIQALPMIWDYAEANPFADSAGNFSRMVNLVAKVIERQCPESPIPGVTLQSNACCEPNVS